MLGRGDAAEQRFVRESLLALGSERPGLRDAARAVRSWERVLAIAAAGSVAESIWSGVSLRGLEDEIPEPARTVLQEAHAGATARNALLLSEAAHVQAAFTAAGIASVILKGPGLLVAHYPDIGARHVADVDILVREGDVARAVEVATAMGAQALAPSPLFYDPADPEWGHVHAPSSRTPAGIVIEIHHRVPAADLAGFSFDEILGRSRQVAWQGRSLRIPAPDDLAAIACLHVFEYHLGDSAFLLRHLADLAVLLRGSDLGWERLEAHVPLQSQRHPLRASRGLVEGGTRGRFQVWWSSTRLRTAYWRRLLRKEGSATQSVVLVLFPPRRFMEARYQVAEGSPLVPLLYLWRPVRGAWSFVTGKWR